MAKPGPKWIEASDLPEFVLRFFATEGIDTSEASVAQVDGRPFYSGDEPFESDFVVIPTLNDDFFAVLHNLEEDGEPAFMVRRVGTGYLPGLRFLRRTKEYEPAYILCGFTYQTGEFSLITFP